MAYRQTTRAVRNVAGCVRGHPWHDHACRLPRVTTAACGRNYTNQTVSLAAAQSQQVTLKSVRTSQTWKNKKASLVIFDKDGTLICFHTMWYPWMRKFISRLSAATNLNLENELHDLLGYCTGTAKFNPGLLAESTKPIIQDKVIKMLVSKGLEQAQAHKVLNEVWEEGSTDKLKAITNTKTLFRILKSHDVKIAISTSDSREGTMQSLKELDLEKYVDLVVCGDDPNIIPKPSPYSAFKICTQLGVDPAEAVMVGDTKADVGMGKAAKMGWNVGVLSGVGNSGDLLPEADHVIHSVKDLLPLILPGKEWRQYYKYGSSERIMMEPHNFEETGKVSSEETHLVMKKDISLVIFDLLGTLMCTNTRYIEWMDKLCQRLEEVTSLDLTAEIYDNLGVCQENKKLRMGVLSEGTPSQVKSKLVETLLNHKMTYEESLLLVNQIWRECTFLLQANTRPLDKTTEQLFRTLKRNGVKIAINTCDQREAALADLNSLGLLKYVDMMVCGDDPHSQSKPSPHNTLLICKEFNINPHQTVVIGDSVDDIQMASAAKVLYKIGVLNGVGEQEALKKCADYIVPKVGDAGQHMFESKHQEKVGARSYSTQAGLFKRFANFVGSGARMFSTTAAKSVETKTYDYVVVGAGSAGCVLSNRLTESGQDKVLTLEAGPKDMTWKIWMPAALMYNLCDDKYNWYYHTEPERGMNNRVMYWPRGRVLGGSSSLNAMVYIRGHAFDYDRWETEGADNWSYASCLPYFRKAQTHELGEDDYRGGSGPLHVSRGITKNPLHDAFIEAGQQAGYPFTDDMNGYQQEGVGRMDMTIHKGVRWSAAKAYLHPVKSRDNLEVKTKVLTTRVMFDNNRAVGVEYVEKGQTKRAMVNKEVILSGGAINSPQLLMLSGVGNADELKKLDIPLVAHLPGVGENLQDHLEVYVQYKCTQPITLYTAQWKFPHNMVRIGLQWFLTQKGWGATAHLESGGFIRSRAGVDHPDLQIHFLPSVVNDHGRKNGDCHAFQFHIGPMRPTSRGHLKLKSTNPRDHPKIVANYMTTEGDMQEMVDAITLAREIIAQKAFDEFRGEELAPGPHVQSRAQIEEFIRNMADSSYHPSCTCKMGQPDDPMAVVDPETKVIGLEGLRVVDASIMPSVVSGNLNGPTIMVAEKAADIIRGIPPLPKSTAPVYRPKTLDTQR